MIFALQIIHELIARASQKVDKYSSSSMSTSRALIKATFT